ncbi:Signal recognition particle, SRP14 subunit [Cynara cardunculus var. scolymus]|uniref:Signal recognition particle 14 kDa protein n=1 Tax=Cynara cardunculus var. scolymus TaxID=59895 RepID=A0A103YF83_CYNCS|nr:Signal recognition particle, SRP14 subunit [Cynara cardunculus var. scolymus]
MVRLQLDPFLNELTSMFEHTTEKGSVWVTLKHCKFVLCSFCFPDFEFVALATFVFQDIDCKFVNYSPASDKSKVQRNKMTTAGKELEYKCLVRATDGKKNISTLVGTKDHQRFQASYATILKARMTSLKKREKKDKRKAADADKKQVVSKKRSTTAKP